MDVTEAQENLPRVMTELESRGYRVFPISGVTGEGMKPLLQAAADAIAAYEPPEEPEAADVERVYRPREEDYQIHADNGVWVITGKEIDKLVAMTMWENDEAVKRFLNILRLKGVEKALRDYGAEDGNTVRVGDIEFELSSDPLI